MICCHLHACVYLSVGWVSKMFSSITRLSPTPVILIWNPQGVTFHDTRLKPWSPVFSCMRTGWMRTGSRKNKIKHWDSLGWGKTPVPGSGSQSTVYKVVHLMHKVPSNYSSCTDRRSGGAQEKGKDRRMKLSFVSFTTPAPLMLMYFFFWVSFEKSHPMYDQTQGSGAGFFNFQEK